MTTLVRTRATAVWALLVALTTLSWALGATHGIGIDCHHLASVLILVVAAFKVRLIGVYFMNLRDAPTSLRALFEGWCLAMCAVTISVYLFA